MGHPVVRHRRTRGVQAGSLYHHFQDRDDIDPVRLRLFIIGQLNWVAEWPRTAVGPHDELTREAVAFITAGLDPPTNT